MANSKPQLTERLLQENETTKQVNLSKCALAFDRPCCQGKGYVISTEAGYTSAALCKCVVNCPICFGKTQIVEKNASRPCRTPSPRRVVDTINIAKIPARFALSGLDKFDNFTGNGKEIINKITNWSKTFSPKGGHGMILSGPVGVGKTYVIASLAKFFSFKGFEVRFIDFFQLLSEIRLAYSNSQSELTILEPLINADILVIDELGKGRRTDFELTVIDQLIMGRYNQQKTIIASTNYQLKDTGVATYSNIDLDQDLSRRSEFAPEVFDSLEARVGKRVFSRLKEMTHFVELTGNDYRNK